MNLILQHITDRECIRRVDSAKRAVALYAPGVSVVMAWADGTDRTSLESESHGHAAQVALGYGCDAKMTLGCWRNVLQRSA